MARRRPLTRETVLEAALALVDEQGVEALTMRGLGDRLGYEAMSLYNHVASKDDILDGVLDMVLAEVELAGAAGSWDEAIRRSAVSMHDTLARHRWACALLTAPRGIRPARLRYMEALLARLHAAGFPAEWTYTAYHVLDGHILGFSLWEAGHEYSEREIEEMTQHFNRALTTEELPHLAAHAEQHFADGPHRGVSAFEYGLDLILDGLRALRGS